MTTTQQLSDKAAIGFSLACTTHCLALPLILAWLPTSTAMLLNNELFHGFMIALVIPSSVLALWLGCKEHRQYATLITGLAGISLLIVAALFGHNWLGETGEKLLTIAGSIMVIISHIINVRLCHQHCECSHH